jgi:hypothetical protein
LSKTYLKGDFLTLKCIDLCVKYLDLTLEYIILDLCQEILFCFLNAFQQRCLLQISDFSFFFSKYFVLVFIELLQFLYLLIFSTALLAIIYFQVFLLSPEEFFFYDNQIIMRGYLIGSHFDFFYESVEAIEVEGIIRFCFGDPLAELNGM